MIPIEDERTYPVHHSSTRSAILSFLILLCVVSLFSQLVPSLARATLINREQRERIREIDRELRNLHRGKKRAGKESRTGLTRIRYFSNRDYSRIVLDLTSLPPYEMHGVDKTKRSVSLYLQNTRLSLPVKECAVKASKGILRCVSAERKGGGVKVEITLTEDVKAKAFALNGPTRLVVDLFRKGKGKNGKRKGRGTPPVSLSTGSVPARGRIVVVIDPGHGGKDPGAIGPKGRKEKNIVLGIALKLRRYLSRDKRFTVYMTRTGDRFISLEKRSAIANGVGADIFLSIHTNASRKRRAKGVSSFVLGKKATDRDALELAMRENGVVIKNDSKVNFILRDLIHYGKVRESLKLAKVINDSIVSKVRKRRKNVVDLGVRKAPFYVLFGAAMPAVLVETSFITNPYGERYLSSSWYQDAIAHSVYNGVIKYVDMTKMAYYEKAGGT